ACRHAPWRAGRRSRARRSPGRRSREGRGCVGRGSWSPSLLLSSTRHQLKQATGHRRGSSGTRSILKAGKRPGGIPSLAKNAVDYAPSSNHEGFDVFYVPGYHETTLAVRIPARRWRAVPRPGGRRAGARWAARPWRRRSWRRRARRWTGRRPRRWTLRRRRLASGGRSRGRTRGAAPRRTAAWVERRGLGGAGPGPRWGGGRWGAHRVWGGRGGAGRRVWVGRSPGIFIGGGFVYDPFVYPYYGYAYPPAYAPGYYGYPPTYAPGGYPTYSDPNASEPSYPDYPPPGYEGEPDPAPDTEATPPPQYVPPSGAEAAPSDDYGSSYGLVQLREVPDGATVELDQRPWMNAHGLDDRWLALPAGMHSITVRA